MKEKGSFPWWIEGGAEVCPICGQTYIYEMECRCTHCDGAVCPWCRTEGDPHEPGLRCLACKEEEESP